MDKYRISRLVKALLVAAAELSPDDYGIFEGRLLAAIEFNAKQVAGLAEARQERQRQRGADDGQETG